MNLSDNTSEIDYEDFVKELYSNSPKDPNTVIIDLDTSNINNLFEKLITLFKDGLVYFYGNKEKIIDLNMLDDKKILKINRYFNSFSINVNFKIVNYKSLEEYKEFIIDPEIKNLNMDKLTKINLNDILDYQSIMSSNLEDRKFKLIKEDLVYIIWFDFIV